MTNNDKLEQSTKGLVMKAIEMVLDNDREVTIVISRRKLTMEFLKGGVDENME